MLAPLAFALSIQETFCPSVLLTTHTDGFLTQQPIRSFVYLTGVCVSVFDYVCALAVGWSHTHTQVCRSENKHVKEFWCACVPLVKHHRVVVTSVHTKKTLSWICFRVFSLQKGFAMKSDLINFIPPHHCGSLLYPVHFANRTSSTLY